MILSCYFSLRHMSIGRTVYKSHEHIIQEFTSGTTKNQIYSRGSNYGTCTISVPYVGLSDVTNGINYGGSCGYRNYPIAGASGGSETAPDHYVLTYCMKT